MRIIVFFDLPIKTLEDKRVYGRFRKHLLKSGFMMLQESVYCKLALNAVAAAAVMRNINENSPDRGLVQLLTVTEKQYANMQLIVGAAHDEVVNSSERLVVL